MTAPCPGSWQALRVPVPGGILAVHEYLPAPAASGEAVVLLHGFTGSHRSWDGVAGALRAARRVIAVDLPGHGRSVVGAGIAAHSMEATAAAVNAALEGINVRATALVGYSMGGRLALYMGVAYPDRVDRLVIESGSPGLPTEEERASRRQADEALAQFALERGVAAFVDRWENVPVLAAERRLPPPARAALRAQRLACSAAGLAASLRGMGTGSQPWLGERLGEIDVPVLLVAGGDDEKFAGIARFMHRRLARACLEVVKGAGHNVHLERPDEFVRVVKEFITAGTAVAG